MKTIQSLNKCGDNKKKKSKARKMRRFESDEEEEYPENIFEILQNHSEWIQYLHQEIELLKKKGKGIKKPQKLMKGVDYIG